jgi:phage-related protein
MKGDNLKCTPVYHKRTHLPPYQRTERKQQLCSPPVRPAARRNHRHHHRHFQGISRENASNPEQKEKKICTFITYKLHLQNESKGIIAYKNYFEDFLLSQPLKVQDKIFKIIEAVESLEHIPSHYLKLISGTNGLYEVRIQFASNIWRIFCFFDEDRLVILLNGFQKKTEKTPKQEIGKAVKLMAEYYRKNKRTWKQPVGAI